MYCSLTIKLQTNEVSIYHAIHYDGNPWIIEISATLYLSWTLPNEWYEFWKYIYSDTS